MSIVQNLENIKKELIDNNINSKVIAVSKTFELSHIRPLIDHGHYIFGENRVQEAQKKWQELLTTNENLNIHLIGGLQTNKAKDAVKLFSCIHSVDRERLVDALAVAEQNLNLKRDYFLQVNTGNEEQKSGINIKGSILCSDAFFPFRDSIDKISDKGIKAIIQPGGSIRDEEVIEACNEHNIAMVFTGKRCFKH